MAPSAVFLNPRPHSYNQTLQTLPCLLHVQTTITRPWPTSLAVSALRISAFISRLPSVPVMSRFVSSSQPLSAPSLIVRCWSRNYFSVRFYPSLTHLTSRSVTSWRPSPCISLSIRGRLSEIQRLLLLQSALITLSLEFSLRLPQNFQPVVVIPTPPETSIAQTPAPNTPTSTTNTSADDTTLDGLGAAELRVLLLAARATHSSPLVTPFTNVVAPSNLFPTFTLTNTSAVSSSSTPKMNRIRSVVTSRGSMTYTGPMNFLDSQDSFDLIFGSHHTMLRLTSGKNRQCASEDTVYLATKLLEFCNFCQLHLFCDSFQL